MHFASRSHNAVILQITLFVIDYTFILTLIVNIGVKINVEFTKSPVIIGVYLMSGKFLRITL